MEILRFELPSQDEGGEIIFTLEEFQEEFGMDFITASGVTWSESLHIHWNPITEFYNTCHSPEDGKFCSGPGAGKGGGPSGHLRDSDGLTGRLEKADIPAKRGPRGGSLADPHEGTETIDGVRGYDKKGKPVPGTDAWLEAHGISKEVFNSRPYVKYEADRDDPAIIEAYGDYEKGLPFWQRRAEQEGQTGGYIMHKSAIPGSPIEEPVPPQSRPNVAVVTNQAKKAYAERSYENSQKRLETLEKTSTTEFIKERKEIVKKAELHLERSKKATPELVRAEAKRDLDLAERNLEKAKSTGDPGLIIDAKKALTDEKRRFTKENKAADNWDRKNEGPRRLYQAEKGLEYAKNNLERAQKDPKQALQDAIDSQTKIVARDKKRSDETAAKYVFTPGATVARIETNPDPQNIKNLTKGKGRIYFAMEGSIKNDAILTAIKREDPTAAVVNVPSVTLWQDNKNGGEAKEIRWFAEKYGKGREIVLIPDADGVTNPQVMNQAKALKSVIQSSGVEKVYLAAPPLKRGTTQKIDHFNLPSGVDEGRKGIDDHLGAGRGTLGQLQYEISRNRPKYSLAEYARVKGGSDGQVMSKNALENSEKALQAISDLAGPKGAAKITKKMLANAAGLPKTTALDSRQRLYERGIIDIEHVYDPVALQSRRRVPIMPQSRINELVKKGIMKQPRLDEPFADVDFEEAPIITIRNPKYIQSSLDIEYGTLSELPTWKPPKTYDGWRSPVTKRKDTTGLAKKVQDDALYNAARNRKRNAAKPVTALKGAPGRRVVRTAEGARRYGVPIGHAIPELTEEQRLRTEASGESTAMVSLTSFTLGGLISETWFEEFYNKCNDEETGRFCEGPDGPGRVRDKSKGDWPSKSGRKITKVSDNTYEVETANGAKIQLIDRSGNAGSQAEKLLNNHARMHEMYPLSPPRNIVIEKPSLFGTGNLGRNDVSIVHALDPTTYINSREVDYDTKSFRTGWAMHSSQTGNTKDMDYIMTHEYGHHVDFQRNSDGYTHRPNALFSDPAMRGTLSRYGRSNDMEAYAETFAEWHHTDGKTKNPVTVAMAQDQGWYGTSRRASGAEWSQMEEDNLLSLQLENREGLGVVDNFDENEGGPRAINYKAKAPTPEEIAKAEKLAREVFEQLGLDYDKAKEE